MRRFFCAFAIAFLLAAPAAAQHHHGFHHGGFGGFGFGYRSNFAFASGFPGFGGFGYGYRSSLGFGAGGPGFHFSAYSRRFYSPFYSYRFVPFGGFGFGPGFGFGNAFAFGNPFFVPQPIFVPQVVPVPVVVPVANNVPANPEPNGEGTAALPPAIRRGDYLVIAPRTAVRPAAAAPIAPRVDRVATLPPKGFPVAVRFNFEKTGLPGATDVPEADAAAEAARQMALARVAFREDEFGAAAERLDRALQLQPANAEAFFLKAQAQFAMGQFNDAVASIQAGLRLDPDWPAAIFLPRSLYGGGPDRFERHLAELREALDARPNELALQFLLAYELWFSGHRAEARGSFRKLSGQLKDASAIQCFLAK